MQNKQWKPQIRSGESFSESEQVSSEEMKVLDCQTIEGGVPSLVLMERAALSVVEVIKQNIPKIPTREADDASPDQVASEINKILCVCGAGNNGGDGFAVARLLNAEGIAAEILFVGDEENMSEETAHQARIAKDKGINLFDNDLSVIEDRQTIVDALFGIGLTRDLEGIYREAVERINAAHQTGISVFAVDIPSGLCADTGQIRGAAVNADDTITFAYQKSGLALNEGPLLSGKIHIADIGIKKVP